MNTKSNYSVTLLNRMVKYTDFFGSMVFEADAIPGQKGKILLDETQIRNRSTGMYRIIVFHGRRELALERIVAHFESRGETLTIGHLS